MILSETEAEVTGTCIEEEVATALIVVHEARSYAVTLNSNTGLQYQVILQLDLYKLHDALNFALKNLK